MIFANKLTLKYEITKTATEINILYKHWTDCMICEMNFANIKQIAPMLIVVRKNSLAKSTAIPTFKEKFN